MTGEPITDEAADIIALLARRGETLAVAESLTGGLIAATLTDVPGASAVFRGGVVAYATASKHAMLGVSSDLLAGYGAVDPQVAAAMARGVRDRFGATYGLASTGVAGPDPAEGKPAGTVYLALADSSTEVEILAPRPTGDRAAIRRATVTEALDLLRRRLIGTGSA